MMSLHKLTAGNGYTYLTRQVAANDTTGVERESLAAYYSERGESPGVWLGSGLDGLAHGPVAGERVHERQMVALFGQGRHPNADLVEQVALASSASPADAAAAGALGRGFNVRAASSEFRRELASRVVAYNRERDRPAGAAVDDQTREQLRTELGRAWFVRDFGRKPLDGRELRDYVIGTSRPGPASVAGYDLTFSPVKSVSALWAVADPTVAAEITAAHDAAVRDVLGWLERTAVYTRTGRDGVAQVNARGLLAVAFTHRDSRAGDPDLHTHVAVSNKVQALDGRWLALDGRMLYRAAVAASERYNTRLEARLGERLGLRFADRPGDRGRRPVREVVGVDLALIRFWSTRRTAIERRQADLAAQFHREQGRAPDFAEQARLYQRANLATRHGKHAPRSEQAQRDEWRREAVAVLGGDAGLAAMLAHVGMVVRGPRVPAMTIEPDRAWVRATAAAAVETVSTRYSTWRESVVLAEIERRARYGAVPAAVLDAVVEATLATALSANVSIRLGEVDQVDEPAGLRRRDGASVFTVAGSQLYTAQSVLDAEARVLAAAARADGHVVDADTIELALLEAPANGVPINDAQAALVHDLATSGRRLQLTLAPAGSGKTTALGALARAWRDDGGEVLGLAPTAVAAAQLRRVLGAPADTVAKLLDELNTGADGLAARTGPRTLVVVDEAAMTATRDLDRAVSAVLSRGGSIRLVGDLRQLASPTSGGVLRDIAETVGAASLDTLVRFADPLEARASLALRHGDPIALGYYLDRGRVHAGGTNSAADQALAAWTADQATGRDALLLAATNELVRELNLRAQAQQRGRAYTGAREPLHDGTYAGAGDVVVTRRNDRRLAIGATDWVKNGDRWHVIAAGRDGGLRVRHADAGRQLTLPAEYVREHVELGYATTVHLAQGSTADTCHTVLTGWETRELLYVAMTRGRVGNHVYLDTAVTDDHLPPTASELVRPPISVEILEAILSNEGAARSATTQHRTDQDPAARLHAAGERYRVAVESAPAAADDTGKRPLPWLPALPCTGDATWDAYLTRRFELVRERTDALPAGDVLPSTRWSDELTQADPSLARLVAAWRVTHDVPASDFRPCGGAVEDDAGLQQRLADRVERIVGELLGPTDRWRELVNAIDPAMTADRHWPTLAAALDRADAAGYDVTARLPALATRSPLPERRAGRELYWRLAADCEAALPASPAPTPRRADRVDQLRAAREAADAYHAVTRPPVSRAGPRR